MRRPLTAFAAALLLAAPALAQQPTAPGSGLSALGGKGGLLAGMLPNVGGATVGNAAGVLSYCVKNKLVGTDGAKSTLGSLLGRQDVTSSKGFETGETGQLVTGNGTGLSLDTMKGKLKTKVCDMVLQQAKSFL